jgi:hypothetical protein
MDEDELYLLTLSDRELCELEHRNLELDEEFGDLNQPVPTDPHDEVFEEVCQPWQRR